MNDVNFMQHKVQIKRSVQNMKRYVSFFSDLIYLYFRNLIFKEETRNLIVTGTDKNMGNSYNCF